MNMSDTPHREPSTNLYRVLAAHRRRARTIAQLHKQAIAAANADRLVQQTQKKADVTDYSRWRKADGVIATGVLRMIEVAVLIAVLGCILAHWM
jgi:hypothetical protein